ncbi:MAG: GuaB3 family IMP dehydrogenase-related protein [Candidatus Limnocylindrales bacterium]
MQESQRGAHSGPRRPSRVERIRTTYGFDDVSLAPGVETIEPSEVDTSIDFAGLHLDIPILAAAMDAVVDVRFAGELARLGGAAVLNLEGVQTRYDDPDAVLQRIAAAPDDGVQALLAEAYQQPVRDDLVARRIEELHTAGAKAVVASTPASARRLGPLCAEHGADLFLVQSQVSSARHIATGYDPLELDAFTRLMGIPVAVGNTTSYDAAYQLMGQGIAAIFVGVGPGAACTTRDVLGIGVPQITAIMDVAAARDDYLDATGRYVPVVADGGMRRGGELAKAVAAGADVLMLGSPLARAEEAPGRGTNWGMAAPSPTLPRGTRIKVGTVGTLERILFGPSHVTDGTENLVGALRQSMAALGARDLAAMQQVEIVHAPAVAVEGKSWQRSGR